ncbi:pilus (MSHA type) biogenesis protein MshL [Methylophilus aquaticus]|uniref:Pilus (MSHA type) biogenesis protein MshL n=1 Tax=Methylophilus aquaticus TaxID=1971610 RepID=A0ABT9JQ32_9PROT|nr:pilus (MSHA type) biogenesis protein MshL [Methylophilus aquaticus]MDP8566648.1 pilus (MSHA type) biogenesis protein MshL [Methylophilus aquaticus]
MKNNTYLLVVAGLMACLTSCSEMVTKPAYPTVKPKMHEALRESMDNMKGKTLPVPKEVTDEMLQPLKIEAPKSITKKMEPRFDLVVTKASTSQVLVGIVSGTPYSMVLSPELTGEITVNLKDVTLFEALNALRELYGLEYRMQGRQIYVEPQTLQTRVFQVNYIAGHRKGESGTKVSSGSLSMPNNASGSSASSATGGTPLAGSTGNNTQQSFASTVSTSTDTDFWAEMEISLGSIVGNATGRSVIVNKQSGLIMVKALPKEIRQVEKYLSLMQVTIDRQVILEAKILRVQLNKGSQQGVNWAAFRTFGNTDFTFGNVSGNTSLGTTGTNTNGVLSATPNSLANTNLSNSSLAYTGATAIGSSMFALAVQGSKFSALLNFLETQGNVEVLSSPRISTLNNQKAVLKVGTDELFVTNVSNNTTATTAGTTSFPQVTLQPYFSGISLDVTPQIDRDDNIILHIHPLVSSVVSVNKQISLGATSNFNIPVPSSTINETDSIVRTRDGNVIAIGGLMTESVSNARSKVPLLGDVKFLGNLFRQKEEGSVKSELVILLKSTVVKGGDNWAEDMLNTQQHLESINSREF